MLGTVGVTANSTTVTQTGVTDVLATALNLQFTAGDIVTINGEERKVSSITNSSVMIVPSHSQILRLLKHIPEHGNMLVFLTKNQ